MKIGINKKIFLDKPTLQKQLNTKLKKPVQALATKKVDTLPFCYEVNFFDDGSGFLCIGESKELQKIFKTERSKGNGGKGEDGKTQKIDKKNVGYGVVSLNEAGEFVFQLKGGFMKMKDAKKIINSITCLKQTIGQNFQIMKGELQEEATDSQITDSTAATENTTQPNTSPEWKGAMAKRTKIKQNMDAMNLQLSKIVDALGLN